MYDGDSKLYVDDDDSDEESREGQGGCEKGEASKRD